MAQTVKIKITSSPRRVDLSVISENQLTFAYVGPGAFSARPSATSTDLTQAGASISFVSPNGESAQFNYGNIVEFTIDAADQLPTATDLDLVLNALAPFFFNVAQPSPAGFSYVQEWGDLANDGSTQDTTIFYNRGSALVSNQTGADTWDHSGRSVDTLQGVFTVVLEGTLAQNVAFGLNIEGTATYPNARYARSKYTWVTTPASITGAMTSRVYELGTSMNQFRQWNPNNSTAMLGIADTGSEIRYGYSLDNGATWVLLYTSLQSYVPQQVFKIDGVLNFGNQYMRVRKYDTALF